MNETLTILERVNTFYSNSFTQLITITLSVLAFAGVFLPMVISFYQNRQLKQEKKDLEIYILNNIKKSEGEITENLISKFNIMKDDINIVIDKLKDDIEISFMDNKGNVLILQGSRHLADKKFDAAFFDYIRSTCCFIVSKNELMIQRSINNLCRALKYMDSNSLNSQIEVEKIFNDLIYKLNDYAKNDRYLDKINKLKLDFNIMTKREPQAPKT